MLLRIIRTSITLLVLWILVQQLDWPSIADQVLTLKWWALPGAIVIQVIIFAVGTSRWWLFFRYEKTKHTFVQLLNPYFVGALFNNVLPAATGGDALRIYHIYKQGYGPSIAASPIITERLTGFCVMFGLASAVIPFVTFEAGWLETLSLALPIIFVSLALVLLLLGWPTTYRPLHNFLAIKSNHKLLKALLQVAESSHSYFGAPGLLVKVIALSIAAQAMEIFVFVVLALGTGAELPLTSFILAVPLILIVSGLPISIGGLGVREAAAITIFTAMGMGESEAATTAILFVPVIIISSLPGLYFFLTNKERKHLLRDAEAHSTSH